MKPSATYILAAIALFLIHVGGLRTLKHPGARIAFMIYWWAGWMVLVLWA